MTKTNPAGHLLYLDTRDLPAERDAQILAANASGFQLMIATDRPEKYRYHPVDHVLKTPLGNYDAAFADIEKFVSERAIKLAGILCWKDREVELASRLSSHFQLPGYSSGAARRVRDKAEMRTAIASLGASPKHAVIGERSEFLPALDAVGCPSLLKPAGNSGSRGIVRIATPGSCEPYDEFRRYNDSAAGDMFSYYRDHALLEQELVGSEHSVAGLVWRGRVFVTGIADKQFEREIFMQYENTLPSRLPPDTQTAMVDVVTEAVTAVGLTDGGFHADIMVDGRGKPYILEIGGRPGGEMINSHLIPLAYGAFSPYDQLIRIMTGAEPTLPEAMYRHPAMRSGSRVVRAPRPGIIERVEGMETVARHPAVRLLMQMKGPGSAIHKPRDKFKEYEVAYIIAQCGLDENIQELLSQLEGMIRIEMRVDTIAAGSLAAKERVPSASEDLSRASTR